MQEWGTRKFKPFAKAGAPGDYISNCVPEHKFTGYEQDETGNDFALARSYAPNNGRFLSPDPLAGHIGNPQSLNRYSYSWNNPSRFVDPSGADPIDAYLVYLSNSMGFNGFGGYGWFGGWDAVPGGGFGSAWWVGYWSPAGYGQTLVKGPAPMPAAFAPPAQHALTMQNPLNWLQCLAVDLVGWNVGCRWDNGPHPYNWPPEAEGTHLYGARGGLGGSSDTVIGYRAVSIKEYNDIIATRAFGRSPFGGEVKYFSRTLRQAEEFGLRMYGEENFRIVSGQFPESVTTPINPATEGPGFTVPNESLPLGDIPTIE